MTDADETQIEDEAPRDRPRSTSRTVHPEQVDAERARGHAGRRPTVPGLLHSDDAEAADEPAEPAEEPPAEPAKRKRK